MVHPTSFMAPDNHYPVGGLGNLEVAVTAFLFGLIIGIPAGWLLLGVVTMVKWPKGKSQGHLAGRD